MALMPVCLYTAEARHGNQGCYSHHHGVNSCDNNVDKLLCNDGSHSPSCGFKI